MTIERWGSLSVRDHLDFDALITNVLLYDRLVIPVPDGIDGLAQWNKKKWEPAKQADIIGKLGTLALKRKWDAARQQMHQTLEHAEGLDYDVRQVMTEVRDKSPDRLTRKVLALEETLDLPAGVSDATVVAGYNSAAAFKKGSGIKTMEEVKEVKGTESLLAVVFHNEITVPVIEHNPEEALKRAVDLSLQHDYRAKRQEYYEWQRKLAAAEVRPEVAVKEMRMLIDDYNALAKKTMVKVQKKFAFTIGGITVGLAGALLSGNPLPAIAALITFVSYKTLDSKPIIPREACQPAAMFHEAKAVLLS